MHGPRVAEVAVGLGSPLVLLEATVRRLVALGLVFLLGRSVVKRVRRVRKAPDPVGA